MTTATLHRCPNRNHEGSLYFDDGQAHHHLSRAQVILCVRRGADVVPSVEKEIDDIRVDEESEAEYLADMAADKAYAEMLERRSEEGSWFGYGF